MDISRQVIKGVPNLRSLVLLALGSLAYNPWVVGCIPDGKAVRRVDNQSSSPLTERQLDNFDDLDTSKATTDETELVRNSKTKTMMDLERAKMADVVLRVRYVRTEGGSKFTWEIVEVLKVLKNNSEQKFDAPLRVAHYSWKEGIPEHESTVYLVPYGDSSSGLWQLLGGDGAVGVSHVVRE